MIRIAIPNRGRLHETSIRLFERAFGLLDFQPRKLCFETRNSEIQIICARSTDIPHLMYNGIVDFGLTGNDYMLEAKREMCEVLDLGFCEGTMSILVLEDDPATKLDDLPDDLLVVTQYPVCAESIIKPLFPLSKITHVDGAAEIYPHLGLCRAILDIVDTGETARANNLRVLTGLFTTSARLYASQDSLPMKETVIDHIKCALQDSVAIS